MTIHILIFLFLSGSPTFSAETRIGLLIEKEQTATYLETLAGFHETLRAKGKIYRFVEKNAKNNRDSMKVISKDFNLDPAIEAVVVLGSAAAKIANNQIKTKPVLFGGINHPKRLGISGANITGTTYYINPATVVNLLKKLKPDIRRVGLLYEPASQNAATLIEVPETKRALKENGIELVERQVSRIGEIIQQSRQIIEADVDYLIIPTNRLLYSNVSLIRTVSDGANVPVVSFSRKGVEKGALIAITSNNRLLGEKMGQMLIDILDGIKSPVDIAWHFPSKYSILINDMTRLQLGVPIAKKIFDIATLIN